MSSKLCLFVLFAALMLGACAGKKQPVPVPDTRPGDRLEASYFVGRWCSNRDLTSNANAEAGHSALLNLSKLFWDFSASGKWKESGTGWMYALTGNWKLPGNDRLELDPLRGNPTLYTASFRNGGTNLYLRDSADRFLVLSRCD